MSDELRAVLLALVEEHENDNGFPFTQLPTDLQRLLFFEYFMVPEIIGSILLVCSSWKTQLYDNVHISVWSPLFWEQYQMVTKVMNVKAWKDTWFEDRYVGPVGIPHTPTTPSLKWFPRKVDGFLDRVYYFRRFLCDLPGTRRLANVLSLFFHSYPSHESIRQKIVKIMYVYYHDCDFDVDYLSAGKSSDIYQLLSQTDEDWFEPLVDFTRAIHGDGHNKRDVASKLAKAMNYCDEEEGVGDWIYDGVWLEPTFNTATYYQNWLKGTKLGNRDWERFIQAYEEAPTTLHAVRKYLSVYKPEVYTQEFLPMVKQLLAGNPEKKRKGESNLDEPPEVKNPR